VTDDESGLVYMRARYYEPGTGRFVSEDPAMDGTNWYVYCGNDPASRVDANGKFWWLLVGAGVIGAIFGVWSYIAYQTSAGQPITTGGKVAAAFLGAVTGLFAATYLLYTTAALTAAAAGEFLLTAVVAGMFGTGFSGMAGYLEKQVNAFLNRPDVRATFDILGQQLVVSIYLAEIDSQ
jgi:hypothetical protein